MIKTHAGRLLYKIYLSLYCKVRKGCVGFHCERELETEQNWNILTPTLLAVTLSLSCSPDVQLEVQRPTLLDDGFLYCNLSASSLDPNSSGLLEGPFGRVWLSLPHLVYNCLQLYFSNSHTNLRALPVRDVTRTLSPRFVSDYYDIWVTLPSARTRPR